MTTKLNQPVKSNLAFPYFFESELAAAFSTRADGNMSLHCGDARDSLDNRQRFLKGLDIEPADQVCGQQVHGSQVRLVTRDDRGAGACAYQTALPHTDALVTGQPRLPLAIFTADCLSVFLYDSVRRCIGLAHAGWRSSRERIVTKTVSALVQNFSSDPRDIYAGFGPAIRGCCYEVSPDFKDTFPAAVSRRGERVFLDLACANKAELLACGLSEKNIFDCGICTSCQRRDFFSYRIEGPSCGRLISVMMLR